MVDKSVLHGIFSARSPMAERVGAKVQRMGATITIRGAFKPTNRSGLCCNRIRSAHKRDDICGIAKNQSIVESLGLDCSLLADPKSSYCDDYLLAIRVHMRLTKFMGLCITSTARSAVSSQPCDHIYTHPQQAACLEF